MDATLFQAKLEQFPFLIMSHRGFWGGNIIENTIQSAQVAFQAGADIVEVDVCRTADQQYYLFHDGNEQRLLGRSENFNQLTADEVNISDVFNSIGNKSGYAINTLAEFLSWLPSDALVNLDRTWNYWGDTVFFQLLEQSGKKEQIVLKSPVKKAYLDLFAQNGAGYAYIPIIKSIPEFELVQTYSAIRTIGVELVVTELESDLLNQEWLSNLKEEGFITVANAENLGEKFRLFGGLSDDVVLFQGQDWTSFTRLGINVIQTDWPSFLLTYREEIKQTGGEVSR